MPRREARPLPPLSSADVARFWEKVNRSGGVDACWLWCSARTAAGYGTFRVGPRTYLAHRISLYLASGIDPADFDALHSCDNPWCVNPAHLSFGSHDDNMAEASARGRFPAGEKAAALHCGERNGFAKLTEAAVRAARRRAGEGEPYVSIARELGVDPDTIGLCVRRVTWKHVTEVPPCA
jgi:hypothetical protein